MPVLLSNGIVYLLTLLQQTFFLGWINNMVKLFSDSSDVPQLCENYISINKSGFATSEHKSPLFL